MPAADDRREKVNAFSIGVELIGAEDLPITDAQYASLAALSAVLKSHFPISNVYGHSHIAPDRKTDPWNFDWKRFRGSLEGVLDLSKIRLPAEASA